VNVEAEAERKMVKARVQLLLDQPFFGYLTMNLVLVPRPEVQTAAVDGIHVYYCPEWIQKLPLKQVEFVMGHEVLHCALDHITRRGSRNVKKWNVACDHAVNIILRDAHIGEMPRDVLYSEKFRGMNAEKIYNLLGDIEGCTTLDTHMEPSDGPVDSIRSGGRINRKDIEERWRQAVNTAKNICTEGYDKIPEGLKRYVDSLLCPKLKWYELLRRYFEKVIPSDYQWIPPNRRYVQYGLILPSIAKEGMTVVIAIDTSGSISDKELKQFVTETTAILSTVKADVYVISCDADIHSVQFYPTGTTISFKNIKLKGGGGTNFVPPFKYVKQRNIIPSVFIYLTDGMGTYPEVAPTYPVIWVISSKKWCSKRPPFGWVVEMEVEE
jgi:predicted metal-dependent peptidase